MGETRVNLLHLLEDLRDAYPGSVEETIVTEMVANALDSGARRVELSTDPVAATVTVTDDGRGMTRSALARYHDLAYTSKRRGRSIGFAGVGIKLGLLISDDVVTESRNKRTHLATSWRLASTNRAPWRWIEPQGLLGDDGRRDGQRPTGTGVRLYLTNTLSPLLDTGFVMGVIEDHFRALLDPDFDDVLAAAYPDGVRFVVNGREVPRMVPESSRVGIRIRLGRQRRSSGVGFVLNDPTAPDREQGIAVSTLGKVIKRGWDWLGLAPAEALSVTGLIEVPGLAEVLTLNKADFIRTGPKGATFLAYRKAIQEPVAQLLAEWGEAPRPSVSRRPRTRSLERDLRSVLSDLSEDFPLIATLIERRAGGQRRLPLGEPGTQVAAFTSTPPMPEPAEASPPGEEERTEGTASTRDADQAPEPAHTAGASVPAGQAPRRPASYGLSIRFESRPDDPALGRLVESTVWVNDAHPAYQRALASRSEGYHIAVAVALALAPLAVEPAQVQAFVTAFLARWGSARPDREAGKGS